MAMMEDRHSVEMSMFASTGGMGLAAAMGTNKLSDPVLCASLGQHHRST
jgi:hypothetical protein